MLPSRVVEGKCLVNCDACEYFSVDFRSGHLMRSVDGCLEYEVSLFSVIAFVSIVDSIYDSAASIFMPTMLLTLIFSRIY